MTAQETSATASSFVLMTAIRRIVLPARAEAPNEKVTGRGVRASTPAGMNWLAFVRHMF